MSCLFVFFGFELFVELIDFLFVLSQLLVLGIELTL